MKPGMLCMGVALESGEDNQGSSGRELVIGPTLGAMAGRLKHSIGESWSFMLPVSIFSCRRHFARRFWNQTCTTGQSRELFRRNLGMLTATETHFGYEVSVLESLKAQINELYSENVCCLRYFSRSMSSLYQHTYRRSLPRVTLDAFLVSLLGHYSKVTGLHGFDVV